MDNPLRLTLCTLEVYICAYTSAALLQHQQRFTPHAVHQEGRIPVPVCV